MHAPRIKLSRCKTLFLLATLALIARGAAFGSGSFGGRNRASFVVVSMWVEKAYFPNHHYKRAALFRRNCIHCRHFCRLGSFGFWRRCPPVHAEAPKHSEAILSTVEYKCWGCTFSRVYEGVHLDAVVILVAAALVPRGLPFLWYRFLSNDDRARTHALSQVLREHCTAKRRRLVRVS